MLYYLFLSKPKFEKVWSLCTMLQKNRMQWFVIVMNPHFIHYETMGIRRLQNCVVARGLSGWMYMSMVYPASQ